MRFVPAPILLAAVSILLGVALFGAAPALWTYPSTMASGVHSVEFRAIRGISGDCYTDHSYPDQANCSGQDLSAQGDGAGEGRVVYIQWDLRLIPANAVIIGADLNLIQDTGVEPNVILDIFQVWGPWTAPTWNNAPNRATLDHVEQYFVSSNGLLNQRSVIPMPIFLVRNWVNRPLLNYGVGIQVDNFATYKRQVSFYSADHDDDAAPLLRVSYVVP